MVEDPTCQHILAEDGDGGRDGLAGVVIEGDAVCVNCLLLEPAIGKIKKNRKQCIQKLPWVVHAHTLDGVCEGTLSPTLTTAHSTTNQHLGNFGEGGHP